MVFDFSNLFARTLTVYNSTHWRDCKEVRINLDMLDLQTLQELNFKKFQIKDDVVEQEKQDEFKLSCVKMLLSIIFSRSKSE